MPPPDGALFQERLLDEPFWMLVACSLVNLTTWAVARHAFEHLRRRYIHPRVLAVAREADLQEVLRPLGPVAPPSCVVGPSLKRLVTPAPKDPY